MPGLADELLPVYDVSDEVAIVVHAEPRAVWDALMRADLTVEGGSLLTALMRTATTDEHARAWFRRYWTFGVGSGAHVLAQALIKSVREDAERER